MKSLDVIMPIKVSRGLEKVYQKEPSDNEWWKCNSLWVLTEVDKVLKQNEAAQASQLEVPYCHIAGCKLGAYKKF